MAINVYTGLMGSGKSYEVVENVILPALLAGRRIVTNVANLQMADIKHYLIEKHDVDYNELGWIVQIQNEDVTRPDFFPVEVKEGEAPKESIVQGGDLVVIDECWRYWAVGMKITPEHMTFFRMHRHFVHAESNVSCDLVLVAQDIGDLHRQLKAVVENTFRMTKLKALGSSKRYRVDVYQGWKITSRGSNKIRELQRTYNPEIFALYRSYSQSTDGVGKEKAIDKRATIWGGALFTIVLPALLFVAIFAAWYLNRYFHPAQPAQAQALAQADKGQGAAKPEQGTPTSNQANKSAPAPSGESDWRVKGHYSVDGRLYVMLVRGDAVRTLVNPRQFYIDPLRAYGSIDGQVLTNYTGSEFIKAKLGEAK